MGRLTSKINGIEFMMTQMIGEFVKKVQSGDLPYGYKFSISDFPEIYGELQHYSSTLFHISPNNGPCRVICSRCESEFDEPTIAMLGKNSVMASFGATPLLNCPKCSSPDGIIVATG